ncbi:MAG: hypothetical protein QOF44_581, partial [Streptomyces sp.]|nr:hypothetical protein [Streptomyces sp.]
TTTPATSATSPAAKSSAASPKKRGVSPRKGDGVRFYVFDGIRNPAAFKRDYRASLDAVPLDDLEKQRVVEECRGAFALNTVLFADLGREFRVSA